MVKLKRNPNYVNTADDEIKNIISYRKISSSEIEIDNISHQFVMMRRYNVSGIKLSSRKIREDEDFISLKNLYHYENLKLIQLTDTKGCNSYIKFYLTRLIY